MLRKVICSFLVCIFMQTLVFSSVSISDESNSNSNMENRLDGIADEAISKGLKELETEKLKLRELDNILEEAQIDLERNKNKGIVARYSAIAFASLALVADVIAVSALNSLFFGKDGLAILATPIGAFLQGISAAINAVSLYQRSNISHDAFIDILDNEILNLKELEKNSENKDLVGVIVETKINLIHLRDAAQEKGDVVSRNYINSVIASTSQGLISAFTIVFLATKPSGGKAEKIVSLSLLAGAASNLAAIIVHSKSDHHDEVIDEIKRLRGIIQNII